MKYIYIAFAFILPACGYPRPKMIEGTNEYRLQYCHRESQCFKAVKKVCPNGHEITKYGNIRPEKFKCIND